MSNFIFNAKVEETRYRYKMLNLVRKEKFDFIMPGAMRDNGVDMWIHVIKRGFPDPFELDFGVNPDYGIPFLDYSMGYIVFTDRGGDRIERAIFGTSSDAIADKSVYDIIGEEGDFAKHVAERNPKRIAINMSEWLSHVDGLSYNGYFKLCKMLGDENAKKLVSSEKVLTDFRARRVQSEIILFTRACEIQRELMESALKSIIPGVTTREDTYWYAQGWLLDKGIENHCYYYGVDRLPQIQHSYVSDPSNWNDPDYVYRRGDMIKWDWGFTYLNFGTDYKRWVYILREGEEGLSTDVQNVWDQAVKSREIIQKTIKSGPTALETLGIVSKAIEDAGFVNTPFTNKAAEDKEIIASLGDSEKIGFSMDCHCVGNSGNSQIADGPSVSPFRKDRAHLKVQPNNLIAFEFNIHSWVPEWGKRFMINLEENALVTERGVEALYPRQEKIIFVR